MPVVDKSAAVMANRLHNLKVLIEQWGTNGLAKQCKYQYASYVSALANKHRPITERTARHIEKCLELAPNWMDTKHDLPVARAKIDVSLVMRIQQLMSKACEGLSITLSLSAQQRLVEFIYDEAQKGVQLDEAYVTKVVGLTRK